MRRLTLIAGSLLIGLLVFSKASIAQTASQPDESIAIRPGSIFEIIADRPTIDTEVNWVLMQDNEFQQAHRGTVFSFRPTGAGTYILHAEIAPQGGTATRRTFQINVNQSAPQAPGILSEPGDTLVQTNPPLGLAGSFSLPTGTQLLQVFVARNDIEVIFGDLNTAVDENGDGDASNDTAFGGTLFESSLTPLHIWFPQSNVNQQLLIAARLTSGRIVTQQVSKSQNATSPISPTTESPSEPSGNPRIVEKDQGDGRYLFSIEPKPNLSSPVIYHWDFGDGNQSLQENPENAYAESKVYAVSVVLRDVQTSEEVQSFQSDIAITVPEEITETPPEETPEEPAKKPQKKKEGGSFLGLLLKIIIVLAVAVGLGILGMFVFSKLKGKSLEKALEDAEKKLVGDEKKAAEEPAPMPLPETPPEEEQAPVEEPKQDVIDTEVVKPALVSEQEEPEEEKPDVVDTSEEINRNVPSWLAPSPDQQAADSAQQDASSSGPGPGPGPETQSSDAAAPSWLQPSTDQPATDSGQQDTASTEPASAFAPPSAAADSGASADRPAPAPETSPAPEAQPTDAAVPSWLQPSNDQPLADGYQLDQNPAEPGPEPGPEPATAQGPAPEQEPTPSGGTGDDSAASDDTGAVQGDDQNGDDDNGNGNGDLAGLSPEERERERKRRKRQRYRANKRAREKAARKNGEASTGSEPSTNEGEEVRARRAVPTPDESNTADTYAKEGVAQVAVPGSEDDTQSPTPQAKEAISQAPTPESAAEPTPDQATTDSAVPSWLQPSPDQQAAGSQQQEQPPTEPGPEPEATPASAPEQAPAAEPAQSAPSPVESTPASEPASDAALPDWLKPADQQAGNSVQQDAAPSGPEPGPASAFAPPSDEADSGATADRPAPEPGPAPDSTPPPAQSEPPAADAPPSDGNLPDWLKPAS